VRRLSLKRKRADGRLVNVNELVLVQGMSDTKATLAEWNRKPWPVFRTWLFWSVMTALGLLAATWLVAKLSTPDPTPVVLPGIGRDPTMGDVGHVLFRNSLVLALHSMACVAGFMAGSTVPRQAALRSGFDKWIHEKAGKFAIAFVICATTFSLCTQAYALGHSAADVSFHMGMSPGRLLVALMPHAVPELTALFLPLAAWVVASRRGDWHQLLAALVIASLVEIYVSPHLIQAVAG
jgi:hypothetical protein